jgi:SAM-dependent methyltransferase
VADLVIPEPGRARAYAGGASLWASDAAPAYGPMAAHLLAAYPLDPSGRRVLDAGAGSGVVGDQLRSRGAVVTSADLEPDMVAHLATKGPAVLADARWLPFPPDRFDLTVAAFVLNHVPDPAAGLAELGRVTAAGGWVLASVFGNDRAPAKVAVDAVAARYGFVTPGWYADQQRFAAAIGTVEAMTEAARRAGLTTVLVDERMVDVRLTTAEEVVRYRCALPQLRAFVAGLDPGRRAGFLASAAAAVAATGALFRPVVIRLVAQPSQGPTVDLVTGT